MMAKTKILVEIETDGIKCGKNCPHLLEDWMTKGANGELYPLTECTCGWIQLERHDDKDGAYLRHPACLKAEEEAWGSKSDLASRFPMTEEEYSEFGWVLQCVPTLYQSIAARAAKTLAKYIVRSNPSLSYLRSLISQQEEMIKENKASSRTASLPKYNNHDFDDITEKIRQFLKCLNGENK